MIGLIVAVGLIISAAVGSAKKDGTLKHPVKQDRVATLEFEKQSAETAIEYQVAKVERITKELKK